MLAISWLQAGQVGQKDRDRDAGDGASVALDASAEDFMKNLVDPTEITERCTKARRYR